MRRLLIRLRNHMDKSLRRQLVFYLVVGGLLPLTMVTAFLFVKARQEMKNQALVQVRSRSQVMADGIDELLVNISVMSDNLAYDEEIQRCIGKSYDHAAMEKLKDINEMKAYFTKIDPFNRYAQVSALYTKKKEVLNFLTPYLDGDEVKYRMLKLGAMDRKKLSIFQWYPLQDNFLKAADTGDVRRDQVVVGVRRIMHPSAGTWMYTQFFILEEKNLYDIYRESAEEMRGSVYIVDRQGKLVSSSDERLVGKGDVPEELLAITRDKRNEKAPVYYQEEDYMMDIRQIENAGWELITMVPVSAVTFFVDQLFRDILLVMVGCIFACIAIITWISRRFLQPVEVLDNSMKEVYDGNLEAYVNPELYHGEIKSMMLYYNAMLVQINFFLTNEIENEKKKKELELEVLMGQINPHFLYNTLENIVWKSNEVGRPDIGRLAASLGRLYRLSIGSGETIVAIQQEVEHVMAYVNIQKTRYKDRIEFDLRVNYREIWGYSTIKLTLQPIVENCFMYAMENISHVLKIRLEIRVKEESVCFRVIDNGSGMTKQQLEEVRKQIKSGNICTRENEKKKRKGTGIGLYSVKERISIYTGYQDSVKVRSKQGIGTLVTCTIPKILQKDKNSQ